MTGVDSAVLVLAAFLQVTDAAPPASLSTAEPEITPPRMQKGNAREFDKCYPQRARRAGSEGRTVVAVSIEADGSVSEMEFAPGIEPWQEETARCVISLAKFTPGKRGGVAVPAQVHVPINFYLETGSAKAPVVTNPKLVSTPVEIEDAYRACYPPDSLAIAQPKYRVSFNERGNMTEMDLVESSGDEALDVAGKCVLGKLKFEPTRRNKRAVRSTVTMPILLRPPK